MLMRFDLGSFLIGLVSGLLIALGIYRLRGVLQRVRQRAQEGVGEARGFLSAPPEVRYAKRAAQLFNTYHIAGDRLPLSALYIEPQLLAPYETPKPGDEESTAVAHIVPIIHDFPAAYAPYNVETLNLLDLQKGERHLALLARSGMGKKHNARLARAVCAGRDRADRD
jgi:hypothetical protein